MKRHTRYILRQLIGALVFVTVALTAAIWLTQSLRFVKLIVNHGVSLSTFLYLTMLLLPTFLLILLPIALFSSIVFTYNKLTMDRELVVMRAAGISQSGLAAAGLMLAGVIVVICYTISLYLMPLSFQAFKDMEHGIRNDYSAVLLREGEFNDFADGLTVYVRKRLSNGELLGILVHDARKKDKPVTMIAERGALVNTEAGPRVVLLNGNRQQVERESGRLSLLYFDKYSVDLGWLTGKFKGRWREPSERFLDELLWPGDNPGDQAYRSQLIAEGHKRLVAPIYALTFALIGLAALLSGDFDRRGQTWRVLAAIGAVVLVQTGALGFQNLAAKNEAALPLVYANAFLPLLASLYVLYFGLPRRRISARPAAV